MASLVWSTRYLKVNMGPPPNEGPFLGTRYNCSPTVFVKLHTLSLRHPQVGQISHRNFDIAPASATPRIFPALSAAAPGAGHVCPYRDNRGGTLPQSYGPTVIRIRGKNIVTIRALAVR